MSGLAGAATNDGSEGRRQLAWGCVVGAPVAEAMHLIATSVAPPVALALCLGGIGAALATIASRTVSRTGLLVSASGWAIVGYAASLVLY